MKCSLTIILLILLSFQASYGQGTTPEIDNASAKLKVEIQRRADVISALINRLSQSAKIAKKQLSDTKLCSIELFNYMDTLSFRDSSSISVASGQNKKLNEELTKTLAALEKDNKLKSDNQIQELLLQLEDCENRITVANKVYNDSCKESGRTDLIFKAPKKVNALEVRF